MALCAREGHLSFYVFVEKIEAQAMGKAASKLKLARAVIVQVVFMFGQAIGIDNIDISAVLRGASLGRLHGFSMVKGIWWWVRQASYEWHVRLIHIMTQA